MVLVNMKIHNIYKIKFAENVIKLVLLVMMVNKHHAKNVNKGYIS